MHNIRTEATRDEVLAAEDAKWCRYGLELDSNDGSEFWARRETMAAPRVKP